MKWLEGWFGTTSGGLGALIIAFLALVTPMYSESSGVQSCSSYDGGPTVCTSSPMQTVSQGPQSGLLILIIIAFLLFVGVLIGTWLDLGGRRTAGRLILLISVSLLLPMSLLLLVIAHGPGAVFALTYPFMLLALVTGILACVRRDEPRALAPVAPSQPTITEQG